MNKKHEKSNIKKIKKVLTNDKPEGNNLRKFANLINSNEEIDPVLEKKQSFKRCK